MPHPWARAEMEGALVWDRRCVTSLTRLCERLADRPGVSFSTACGSDGRQAAHRICTHPSTTVAGLLAGHYAQTAARVAALDRASNEERPLLLVAQDTTTLDYSSHPATTGLGHVGHGRHQRGLFAHAALALTPDGTPLGLLHLSLWTRDPKAVGQKGKRGWRPTDQKESQKWLDGLAAVEAALPIDQSVLLIQDREADVFAFFAAPRRPLTHLLLRACQPRQVRVPPPGEPTEALALDGGDLMTVAATAPVVGELRVVIPRAPKRPEREAVLRVRSCSLQVLPPKWRKGPARQQSTTPVRLWVVRATEVDPPPAAEAVDWVLLTSLPLDNPEAACQVVRYYARRWVIERLHFTLKSGLRVERLQIDEATTLMHTVALCYVVAWRLLFLTYLARHAPATPVAKMLDPTEHAILAQQIGQPIRNCREAVRAIASLGGFPGNPAAREPGVKTLWLGLTRLEAMVLGWRLAHAQIAATIQD
jgi:hypothetical protein